MKCEGNANPNLDGGYEKYLALWWSQMAGQQPQGQGGAGQAPGTS